MNVFKNLFLIGLVLVCLGVGLSRAEETELGKLWMAGKQTPRPSEVKTLDFNTYQVQLDSYGNIVSIKAGDVYMLGSNFYPGDIGLRLRAEYTEGEKKEMLEQCAWGSVRNPMKFFVRTEKDCLILTATGGGLGVKKITQAPKPDLLKYSEEMVFQCDGKIKIRYEIVPAADETTKLSNIHLQLKIPLLPGEKISILEKGAEPDEVKEVTIPEEYNDYYLLWRDYLKLIFSNPAVELVALPGNIIRIHDPRGWAKAGTPGRSGKTSAYIRVDTLGSGPRYIIEFALQLKIPYGEIPTLDSGAIK
jgi:hypothetical protein